MTAPIVIAERCHWCSRQVTPSDLIRLSTGQRMCLRCHAWHHHALDVRAGTAIPHGCQQCGLSTEALAALDNGPATRMFVVPVDGIYAVFCLTCKVAYCRKRADLYKETGFGREMKL